jgi:hypothetical protein
VDPRHNLALLPVEKDSINGLKMIRYLAMIAAIRYPGHLSYGQLKLLLFWDPVCGDVRMV